jgi:hypothetical protein
VTETWVPQLEATLVDSELAIAVVTVAAVAGRSIEIDEDELRGASRRALFVLAAGGDPDRGLDLEGPAVNTFAAELDDPGRREMLRAGLIELAADSTGFAHLTEVVHALLDAPESAWRAYACSLLAEQLADED